MHPKSVWGVMALLGVVAAFVLPAVVLAVPVVASPSLSLAKVNPVIDAQPGQFLSLNWAGYAAAYQPPGSVSKVAGSWVEPAVKCLPTGTQLAAFWVGMDGWSSDTVEQTGTLAICQGGMVSYTAWWELYPTNAIQEITTFAVKAGDHMTASVVYHSLKGTFTMNIKDLTNGGAFSKTAPQAPEYAPYANETSAECIIERPAGEIGSGPIFFFHLANFGKVTFSSCTATIGGLTGGVGDFSPAAVSYMVTLNSTGGFNPNHVKYLAEPGPPTNLVQWAFTTTWAGYGTKAT